MIDRLTPRYIKRKAYSYFNNIYRQRWYDNFVENRVENEKLIPKYDLEQKHIGHLQTVLDRNAFLEKMPKNSICAEIGVDRGEFSTEIVRITQPKKLHLIDAWGDPLRYHDGLKLAVKEKFEKEIKSGLIEMNIGFSTTVLKNFPDHYFDWVYLDTDHTYKVTADELAILKTKVKQSGIIAGHDYTIGNWAGDCRYGVVEAVHELCVMDNWELLYLTCETHQFRSFAIRNINLERVDH